ncbi:MAG: signal peptidase II [bacterium JZ-2024 1]
MRKILIAALAVIALDQLTKQWVERKALPYITHWVIPGLVGIHKTYNKGIIFGFFQDSSWVVWVVIVIAASVLLYSTYTEIRSPAHSFSLYALGLIWGGAMGNLLDRIRTGKVVDFIAVWKWPIFNLADSSIVLGILVLMLFYSREGKREGLSPQQALSQESHIEVENPDKGGGEESQ